MEPVFDEVRHTRMSDRRSKYLSAEICRCDIVLLERSVVLPGDPRVKPAH